MALYIAKLTADGSLKDVRRFTDPNTRSGHPRFSPDGRWLVYTSGVSGINDEQPLLSSLVFSPPPYGEIWDYRISDGVHVRLTDDKWEDGAPFWAPERVMHSLADVSLSGPTRSCGLNPATPKPPDATVRFEAAD